ncbi:MAG: DinB family protein [bacterium]
MIGYGSPELAAAFRTVRGNTVQIAKEIPEDQYDFVAAPGVRPVRELLAHIAFISRLQEDFHRVKRVTTLSGYDFVGYMTSATAEEKKPRSKAEIVTLLETRGEEFARWLESLTPDFLAETYTDPRGENPRTRFENLLSAKEHEMHHRGQLMFTERMLGIVPHLTRQMQERMAAHR